MEIDGFTDPSFLLQSTYKTHSTMKGVTLTERIKYMHCEDEDGGTHGILVLLGVAQWPTKTAESTHKPTSKSSTTTSLQQKKHKTSCCIQSKSPSFSDNQLTNQHAPTSSRRSYGPASQVP